MQILNDARPWFDTQRGRPLSIADLVSRETLTPETAATLWWTLQQGASAFVAAGPPGAGKSAIANALLEFLPDNAHMYVTSGAWDRLDVPSDVDGPVYLLVNELSAHLPVYLYGPAAKRAFALLPQGIGIFGTLHARSAVEALQVMCYEGGLAPESVATPFVFPVIAAYWDGPYIVRRVVEIGFLPPHRELMRLSELALDSPGIQSLAAWSGIRADDVRAQIIERATQLLPV